MKNLPKSCIILYRDGGIVLLDKYMNIYKHSFVYFIVMHITAFIMRLWNGSLLRHIFYGERGFEKEFKIKGWLEPLISGSFFCSKVKVFFDNLLEIRVRSFGIMLFWFSVFGIISSLVLHKGLTLPLYIVILITAVALVFLNYPSNKIYNDSFFLRLLGGFFGLEEIGEKQSKYSVAFFTLAGIALAVLSCVLGLEMFIMAVGGVVAAMLILSNTYAGVFITVLCIPVLPTKFILGLCLLCVASFAAKLLFTGKASIKFEMIDFFVCLFALIVGYSVITSYIPSNSIVVVFTYILFISFYFVVKNTVDTKEKLFALISAIIVSGFFVALFGIYQKLTGKGFTMTDAWIDTDMFEDMTARIYSTLDNPNVLGEYMIFIIMLSFAGVYYFKGWQYKLASFAAMGASGLCMIYTLSRGAWLGLIFALVLFTLIKDRRLIWVGIVAVLALPFFIPDSIIERFMSIGDLQDSSSSYRLNIWLASLEMIKDFWPTGIGPGTKVFVYIYQKFAFTAVYAPHSHNLFLQVIIDYGIAGLLLFLGIIFVFYNSYLSKIKYTDDSFLTAAGAALCAAMGGYLLQGMTDNVWYNYRIVAFFWVVIALSPLFGRFMKDKGRFIEDEKI